MSRKIVVVGADLMAKSRLEPAAARAGAEIVFAPRGWPAAPTGDADLVVVDLDAVGSRGLESAGAPAGVATVGYYSHVDDTLADAARAAGIEPIPRGRFWRDLDAVLARAAADRPTRDEAPQSSPGDSLSGSS